MYLKRSFWGHKTQLFPQLTYHIKTDHLIIGGGIGGLMSAYFLLQRGQKNIVLIERNTIGSGSTGHSAGMLIAEPEQALWPQMIQTIGVDKSREYLAAQQTAAKTIRSIIKTHNIECDYEEYDLLFLAKSKEQMLDRDIRARGQLRQNINLLKGIQFDHEFHTPYFTHAFRLRKNIGVNPLRLARGLAAVLVAKGVSIFEHSPADSSHANTVMTPKGQIDAVNIVRAGNNMTDDIAVSYLTTIAVTKTLNKKTRALSGLDYKDMFVTYGTRSYFYGRVTHDHRLLIGYGDYRTTSHSGHRIHLPHLRSIKRFKDRLFPQCHLPLEYGWSALYRMSKESLPHYRRAQQEWMFDGAGTQLSTVIAAKQVVNDIMTLA